MVKFALIGGRTNKELNLNLIEKHIFSLTNKDKPNVLFVPFAAKDYNKANLKFGESVSNLDINLKLMTMDDVYNFDFLLEKSDVLYIGGGCVNDLISFFKKFNYLDILYKYINTNKIYSGISAGAMLYTKYSMGDRDMFVDCYHKYNYKMVDCLDILNISICPHFNEEDLIIYIDEVKRNNLISFGIENDTMLIIDDNKYSVFKEDKSKSVYYFGKDKIMLSLYEGGIYEENCSFRTKGDL